MSEPNKGKPTEYERKFVAENREKMSVKEMAQALNRRSSFIYKLVQSIAAIGANTASALDERSAIVAQLKKKNFFKLLGSQLTPQEVKFFIEEWTNTVQQFSGDLLPTEESELKDLIMTDIMKNRLFAENKNLLDQRNLSDAELRQLVQTSAPRHEQAKLKAEIGAMGSQINANNKSIKELTERATKLRDSLSASRRQRVDAISNAKIDMTQLLKVLQDRETRERAAREMVLLRQAKNKALKKYSEEVVYADGKVDKPVITHLSDEAE